MATPPLFVHTDLDGFPGAPFTSTQAARAAEDIRAEAGWHIAPSITETLVVDSDGGRHLFLDTLHLTAVAEVRDVTNDTPVVLTGYRTQATARFRAGLLDRPAGWPVGVLEVDITHGYHDTPAPILRAAAALIRESTRGASAGGTVRLGSLSMAMPDSGEAVGVDLARYVLPGRP